MRWSMKLPVTIVGNSGSILTAKENVVNVRTLERCFNKRNDREMGVKVITVQDRIQKAILTAISNNISRKIERTSE